jgi:hypothetical protein
MGYGNWELEVSWLLLMMLNSYPGVCVAGVALMETVDLVASRRSTSFKAASLLVH